MRRAFLLLLVVATSSAQTPGPTFDVASVKPNTSDSADSSMRQTPGGGIVAMNVGVRTLISRGYPGLGNNISGLPDWVTGVKYDVSATASLKNPTAEDRQAMIRALLADRFKLAAHVETREQPAFDLVLARKDGKLGPRIKPAEIDCAARAAAQRAAAEAARAAGTPPPPPTVAAPAPGSLVPPCSVRMMGNVVEGDLTMAGLAGYLRSAAGREVVDKTGLTGNYRVTFEAGPVFQSPAPNATPGTSSETPSIFTALQEQLGLKLESSRARVEVLIIDHIERPSEN